MRKIETWEKWLVVDIIDYVWASIEGLRLMDTVRINMSWPVFSEIRDKYPQGVLNNIDAGVILFPDSLNTVNLRA